ncbi:MAG: hypothetical protein Q9170_001588 [Blastenia crenularia]
MEDPLQHESTPIDESPVQKQARLRRERREAKIKAGGSARLDKITQVSGRPAEPAPLPPANNPPNPSIADPDEGDISHHQYPARTNARNGTSTEVNMRQLLRGAPPSQGAPHGLGEQQAEGQDDPMVHMLQQMMGGIPGAQRSDQTGLPPGLGALLGGGGPSFAGLPAQEQRANTGGYLWKITHAMFAFLLGIYMTAVTTFSGAKFSRVQTSSDGVEEEVGKRLFWIFATAEVMLQGSRYLLENGKTTQSGWMGMLIQVLPEPWKNYVGLMARYSGIWTTIVEDAMAVVFVLGCVAWWKGATG